MKCHTVRQIGLILAVCLLATSAGAKQAKLDSVDALARALSAKLPRGHGEAVYVGLPSWKGQGDHYLLRKEVGGELARSLSAVDPADKVVSSPEATEILAKAGLQPLDVYIVLDTVYAGRLIGVPIVITTEIRREKDGMVLAVEARDPESHKRYAKLKALVSISPQIVALLTQPDVPIKNRAGVYVAGVGGVGEPVCVHFPSPQYQQRVTRAISSQPVMMGVTIGTSGKASDVVLLADPPAAGINRTALKTVRSWRFRPARGPGGELVPVRILVEISVCLLP